jgi:beta-lactamase superfamily II metal-dependent hydrolase
VPNLSSISLHLRYQDRTALLTGDARGDRLRDGLEATDLLDGNGRIQVDLFKLPHHGSRANADDGRLFDTVRADHYVVCADGVKHHHPDLETLDWMVASRGPQDRYTIHLTNPIPHAEAHLATLGNRRALTVSVGSPRVEIGW